MLIIVGGKNASLGEMIHAGLPVPFGFAVYSPFLRTLHCREET